MNEALLWTQGSVAGSTTCDGREPGVYRGHPLKPVPSPVFAPNASRAPGDGTKTCAGILGLTKMDWNNNTLYKKLPVTLVYSGLFASIIQQNPNVVDTIYDFRYFM